MATQKKCIRCGNLIDCNEGALFCPFCGTKQTPETSAKNSVSFSNPSDLQSRLDRITALNNNALNQTRKSYESITKNSFGSSRYSSDSFSNKSSFTPYSPASSHFSTQRYTSNAFNTQIPSAFNRTSATGRKDHGADVYESNINGILEIACFDGDGSNGAAQGSGFIISDDGYALTNTHVVTHEDGVPFEIIAVYACGEWIPASIVALGDEKHGSGGGVDLAVLKLEYLPENVSVLTFEHPDNIRNGERVFVIGNSLGQGTCITNGVVSDKDREISNYGSVLMTDCPTNPGNSGGPIFNDKGKVIGVMVAVQLYVEGMNYAIPLKRIYRFVQDTLEIEIY